jgi:O-methyltransferase
MKLLSDQVDERELSVVLRELQRVLTAGVSGDVTEFGCYVGTTSVYLAERLKDTGRMLWLYDSFEGLPPKTSEDSSPVGEQFVTGELLATKKQLISNLKQARVPMPKITKGWFSDLTRDDVPNKVAFAFLDGDYYHSVKDPLKLLWPVLSPGAIVVVDDYANEALPGAAKAVNEWLIGHQATIKVEHSLAIIQLPS